MAAQNEERCKVSFKKTMSVYPKPLPSRTHFLSLSNLDRKCPTLMYLVLFYESSQNLSDESLFTSLKRGLEGALSVWYPAAGRLILNSHTGKLDLFCNNSGAVLVQAATQVRISELGDLSHYNKFYENLVYRPFFSGNFFDMPVVTAQVTRFGCGGYSLGVGISHSLFDGLASLEFLTAWASLTAKRKSEGSLGSFQPVHDRGRLLVEATQNQCSADKPGRGEGTRVVAFEHLHQLIEQAASSSTASVTAARDLGSCKFSEIGCSNQEGYVLKTYRLTGQMIENLKRKVISGKNIGKAYCSSFEVVAAHLWKARTKALGLSKERRVSLQFAVDTRNKMNPPLARLFSGNAYVLSSVSSTAGEVEEESLETIVEKIKEAKGLITDGYVKAYVEALDTPQRALPPIPELTMVSDWTRMPFHAVDFGHGSAIYAYPLSPPLPQVAYMLQSPNDIGGIDVRIGLLNHEEQAFTRYFLS